MNKYLEAYTQMKLQGMNHMSEYDADMAIDQDYLLWEDFHTEYWKTYEESKQTLQLVDEEDKATAHQKFIHAYTEMFQEKDVWLERQKEKTQSGPAEAK